jgi:amino-acid N-acetyltransferase
MGDGFTPGGFWTPGAAADAVRAMERMRDAPEMQRVMQAIADASDEGHDPASAAAEISGVASAAGDQSPIARDACVFRRGRAGDEDGLASLIVEGHLPPFFIEPFLEGFLVVEHAGEIVGCGCAEMYGDCSVIRSVVVSERGRGLGLGLEVARLLEEDARLSGANDLYLFTIDAWRFWQRLGYNDLPLDAWKEPATANWQYQFVSQFPDAVKDVHAMWKPA